MTPADIARYEQMLRYELAAMNAEERLKAFCSFTMPHPKAIHDPAKSAFIPARHLDVLTDAMESVERGEIKKLIVNMPPRHGKSETMTKRATAWISGRNPDKEVMVATYGQTFARDFSESVAAIMRGLRFRQAFPEYRVVKADAEAILNHQGKNLFFLGRRSPTTGRGGNWLLVDDPMKDDKEVRSPVWRDDIWEWFTQTLLSRRHDDQAPVVLTATRWHEDDVIGRIVDTSNPKYSKEFSEGWEVINLPALAEENDPMGRKPGEALWPEKFGVRYLEEMRAANPMAFSSLYQGDPTPAEGSFYLKADLHTYGPDELPAGLRMFGASDHAVGLGAHNDPSCLGMFGVCPQGNAYILPDLVWRRISADQAVEEMFRMMAVHKPLWWYAERGHITRSIGPFLKKRMEEEGVYCPIVEDQPVADKMQRAQSARARCAQGRILFPKHAAWWPRAEAELLKFPNARHDDFVDFLSIVGMKLQSHVAGTNIRVVKEPAPGSWAALKAQFNHHDNMDRARKARAGW